MNSQLVKSYC